MLALQRNHAWWLPSCNLPYSVRMTMTTFILFIVCRYEWLFKIAAISFLFLSLSLFFIPLVALQTVVKVNRPTCRCRCRMLTTGARRPTFNYSHCIALHCIALHCMQLIKSLFALAFAHRMQPIYLSKPSSFFTDSLSLSLYLRTQSYLL